MNKIGFYPARSAQDRITAICVTENVLENHHKACFIYCLFKLYFNKKVPFKLVKLCYLSFVLGVKLDLYIGIGGGRQQLMIYIEGIKIIK